MESISKEVDDKQDIKKVALKGKNDGAWFKGLTPLSDKEVDALKIYKLEPYLYKPSGGTQRTKCAGVVDHF